ncbi:MAG: PHP domain-containing protein, partial [Synergistaceae bacterium]|nr:PHP domain-containing protein [Synergistaceae bacterium]
MAEIVRGAKKKGISLLALTDHDTLDGWEEFRRLCTEHSIRPLSGVELSAKYDRTVHILGYRIKDIVVMNETLRWVRCRRAARNEIIISRLRELGLSVTMEDVSKYAGEVIARPHFAQAVVAMGYVRDYQEAFDKYLARGAAAYAARESLSPVDCVTVIRSAGGLPVLAHPSLTGLDDERFEELILSLKNHGMWGLECLSSHCSSEKVLEYLALADKYSLFPTAGSDFHGSVRPAVSMGVQVTDDFLPWARL